MRTYTSYYGSSTDSPAYSAGNIARIINNTQTDNLNWGIQEVNQSIRYLVTKYYFNERTYTVPSGTVAQQQFYNLPPQVKKVVTLSITIGGVVWNPIECPTQAMWNRLNVIQFYQDYPSHFYIYNGQVGLFPIPATSGGTISVYYKTRIQDLSMADVTNVTANNSVSISNGTTTLLAGAGTTTFLNWMANNYIRIPHSSTNSTDGDNQWYQIASVSTGTTAFLANQYSGNSVTSAPFTIGEVPILPEDYQDLPLYRMANLWYTTRAPNPLKAQEYQKLWDDGIQALDEEYGSKTTSVVLPDIDAPMVNPNLFQRSVS